MKTRMTQMMKLTAEMALLACLAASIAFAQIDPGSRTMMRHNDGQTGEQANRPNARLDLTDPFGLLHRQHLALPESESDAPDAMKLGLAKKKTYTFSTADYPGGDFSALTDTNGSTAVGYFAFTVKNLTFTAFTLTGNDYKILSIPGSIGGVKPWRLIPLARLWADLRTRLMSITDFSTPPGPSQPSTSPALTAQPYTT